ncbi:non-ribosomal peptide synthetase [Penicillium capsulatum]|uniref:Non-ribosomal peptide synthetase n=1 Tax=Penicillium capsulatum TaxID=69766 RepID=A0A9W9LR42_9EURO|nr:non-ribosomal peptide synthetase [Penicillium capsulatum]KAJ6135497.1 non-ribosomal peptide synthetase [Penicillium capsulatum]
MEQAIYTHARQNPNAIAVVDGDVSRSYSELFSESNDLAQKLKSQENIGSEELFAIILGPGIKQVIAQLAVRLAGGTCVPIEPSLPERRIQEMLHDINVKHIVTERHTPVHLTGFTLTYVDLPVQKSPSIPGWKLCPGADRSHILFTSGSTGRPKPVQIKASGIMHLAKNLVLPLVPVDRVAEFNNPGFDISIFEIWVTLISGATIVCIPRQVATDPHGLSSFLKEHRVSVSFLTAALFEIIAFACPSVFSTLSHVLLGGEAPNTRAMKKVLEQGPPIHIWNTYGPTECITMTTMFEVTLEEANGPRISIGRPIGDMEVFLLDENQVPISEYGKPGEIYIAGPQQSLGYLNRPRENETYFVPIPARNLGKHDDTGVIRLYRTGDLGEWRPDSDILDFCGRSDTQIKHGGFRVELREIEQTLLRYEAVQSAVVIRQPSKTVSQAHALVAFLIVDNNTAQDPGPISDFARKILPSYMVPNIFEIVQELPLTVNGKVDRKGLLERRIALQEQTDEYLSRGMVNSSNKKTILQNLWKDLLSRPAIHDDDDFFALGGTSMKAAALIALIQDQTGRQVSMNELYEHSRLSDLARHIDPPQSAATGNAPDDTGVWMKDVDLVDDITLVPDWQSEDEGRVFLTGVTGFVGAHLVHELMHRSSVKQIACLVRPLDNQSPVKRVKEALDTYDLWPESESCIQKLLVLEGDMADPTLGLGLAKFAWLADWASVIFHLGAKVNFCESYREHRASNILGTCNVLQLAATGRRKPFHYVSSVDAWGPTGNILGTRELFEDGPLQPHVQGLRYDLGYAQSQWAAESMVRRMRDRGLPIVIYRPGFIIGHSETGASNPKDFMVRLIVGSIQLGLWPKLTQNFEYTPVDYVISAMLHVSSSKKNLGRSYSLLPPNPRESVTVEGTCHVINDAGYPVKIVNYEDWARAVIQKQRDGAPLAPLVPMVQERVLGALTRWEASQYTPWYRSDNTIEALRDRPDIRCHLLDVPLLERSIAFWNRKGFYRVVKPIECE